MAKSSALALTGLWKAYAQTHCFRDFLQVFSVKKESSLNQTFTQRCREVVRVKVDVLKCVD